MTIDSDRMKLPSNKKFGFFFTAVFLFVSAKCFYSDNIIFFVVFASCGALTLLATLFRPTSLSRFNRYWMKLGMILGSLVNPVIMSILFFLLITPVATTGRLFGRDELKLRRPTHKSNWCHGEDRFSQNDFKLQI